MSILSIDQKIEIMTLAMGNIERYKTMVKAIARKSRAEKKAGSVTLVFVSRCSVPKS
jgi:hypothetical protein